MTFRARSFPHPRGDGPEILSTLQPAERGFPHPRGDGPTPGLTIAIAQAVFPTRVGMVRAHGRLRSRAGRFPHPRGDGPIRVDIRQQACRFSPPAWGWSGSLTVSLRSVVAFSPPAWGWSVFLISPRGFTLDDPIPQWPQIFVARSPVSERPYQGRSHAAGGLSLPPCDR